MSSKIRLVTAEELFGLTINSQSVFSTSINTDAQSQETFIINAENPNAEKIQASAITSAWFVDVVFLHDLIYKMVGKDGENKKYYDAIKWLQQNDKSEYKRVDDLFTGYIREAHYQFYGQAALLFAKGVKTKIDYNKVTRKDFDYAYDKLKQLKFSAIDSSGRIHYFIEDNHNGTSNSQDTEPHA